MGRSVARDRREEVSGFQYTVDEKLMRDTGDQLLARMHKWDWTYQVVQEAKRTRVLASDKVFFTVDRYYEFLNAERFRTGESKFYRIRDEALSDCDKIDRLLKVADRVFDADDRRLEALRNNPTVDPAYRRNARARVTENDNYVQRVGEAVIYRFESYLYATDRLSVELPDEHAVRSARDGLEKLRACGDIRELGPRNYDDINGKRRPGPLIAAALDILRQ